MAAVIQSVFLVLGGLGLFLYGMKLMSDGLENMAGDRMRVVLERMTSNRFLGIAAGAAVTCVIQSSSATTVMVVGFVNAGLMTLIQGIGVIMGANIGTTITAQMISFKIGPIAPLVIFIGLLLYMFVKKRNVKTLGMILLGFGVLFFGISVMGEPLKAFAEKPGFQAILTTFSNPFLSLLAGLVFTAIIQSSSATTSIVVALYLGGVDLPFISAVYLVLGSNIGTCITAALASLTASRESKRAALSHVLFNVTGCAIFGSLIAVFPGVLTWIQHTWPEGERQVAMFHTLFNVSTVVLLVPFVKQLAWLVQKLIPEKPGENANAKRLIYLDPAIMQTPAIAVAQAHRELCRMGEMAKNNLHLAIDAFYARDGEKAAAALEVEDTLNFLNHQITAWLVRIRGLALSMPDTEKLGMMLRTVSDIERVGDHAENIAEYALLEGKFATKFSPEAIEELRAMSETVLRLVALALEIFESGSEELLPQVDPLERVVDRMAKDFIETHIRRLKSGACNPRSGVVFTDMVTDLERCADHATNIAYSILGEALYEAGRAAASPSGLF